MRVRSNGVELNAALEGPQHAACITFIGGIANDHSLWEPQARAFASTHRVLRFDARGHGSSTATPAPYSLELLAGDVAGAWDVLGIARSAVAGLGLGGVVAAEIAWRHPERVSALIPVSCRAQLTPEYRAIWPPMIERAASGGMAAIAEPTIERWFSPEFRAAEPALIARVRAAILATTLEGYLGSIAALLTLDWAQRLGRFAMPVMYVSGEDDRVGAPPAVVQAMCDATPGSSHVVLPGATHISVACNPGAFNGALASFLASAEAQRGPGGGGGG